MLTLPLEVNIFIAILSLPQKQICLLTELYYNLSGGLITSQTGSCRHMIPLPTFSSKFQEFPAWVICIKHKYLPSI